MGRGYRHLTLCLALSVAFVWLSVCRAEPTLVVIVPRNAPALELNRATLRDVYLKKIVIDDRGQALVPVNLPPGHPLRQWFSGEILHTDDEQLQSYWNERYFHGVRPPYVLRSQTAIVRFVARTAGAIGYVASCRLDDSVKAVMTVPLAPAYTRRLRHLCEAGATPGADSP